MTRALAAVLAVALAPSVALADNDARERPFAPEPFGLDVFRARREKLRALMKGGVGVVLSTPRAASEDEPQDQDFAYLTGQFDERDAALLLAPGNAEDERDVLFLSPGNVERDRIGGYRASLPSAALEERTGFSTIARTGALGVVLATLARETRLIHSFANNGAFDREPPKLLEMLQKTAGRVPGGAKVEDSQALLGRMRMVKEPRELERIQRATDITLQGHLAAWRSVRPGMRESDLKETLEAEFRKHGARKLSYPSIVGAGADGCVLHYRDDDKVINDGELVLIDAAASWDHYMSDVTRTFPANGRFAPEQRKLYEIVLRAQNAALAKVRPGVTWHELNRAAQDVMREAGQYEHFVHGVGHHVGLNVHDLTPWSHREPILEGSVITIEPGIYLPETKTGIRIEDIVLVTKDGPRLLSGALPREPDQIERAMAEGRR